MIQLVPASHVLGSGVSACSGSAKDFGGYVSLHDLGSASAHFSLQEQAVLLAS